MKTLTGKLNKIVFWGMVLYISTNLFSSCTYGHERFVITNQTPSPIQNIELGIDSPRRKLFIGGKLNPGDSLTFDFQFKTSEDSDGRFYIKYLNAQTCEKVNRFFGYFTSRSTMCAKQVILVQPNRVSESCP